MRFCWVVRLSWNVMAVAKHPTSLMHQLTAGRRLESAVEGWSAWRLPAQGSAANAMYGVAHSDWKPLVSRSPARQLYTLLNVFGRALQQRDVVSVPFCLSHNGAEAKAPLAAPSSLPSTSALNGVSAIEANSNEYVVVNFYHLTAIADPLGEVDRQAAFMKVGLCRVGPASILAPPVSSMPSLPLPNKDHCVTLIHGAECWVRFWS